MFDKIRNAAHSAKEKIEYWATFDKWTGKTVPFSEAVNNPKDVVWKWISRRRP